MPPAEAELDVFGHEIPLLREEERRRVVVQEVERLVAALLEAELDRVRGADGVAAESQPVLVAPAAHRPELQGRALGLRALVVRAREGEADPELRGGRAGPELAVG